MESVGFKEWAIVCEALGGGEQSVILRKGGIAEGRDGFTFRHAEFFLFPTYFHEQLQKTRSTLSEIPRPRAGEIEIKFYAKMECSAVLTRWDEAAALEPFHILQSEVVRERFDYDAPPEIYIAFVRVFRLQPKWVIPDAPRYGGCRSWLQLPVPLEELKLEPVLSDHEHRRRSEAVKAIIATSAVSSK